MAIQVAAALKDFGWLDGGIVVAAVVFVVGLKQRWWVMGQAYTDLKEDRDHWRGLYEATRKESGDA